MNFPDAAGISPWLGYSVGLRTPSRGVGANSRPCWGRSFQDFDRGARPNQATDLHQGIPAKNRLFMPSTAFCEQRKRLWPRSNPGLGIDGRRHASHAGLDQFQFDAPDSDSFPSVFRPRFGPAMVILGLKRRMAQFPGTPAVRVASEAKRTGYPSASPVVAPCASGSC